MIQTSDQYLPRVTPKAADLRETIAKGSKSFFLASLFFPKKTRQSCWVMYRWCRQCDDRVDDAATMELAKTEAEAMRTETLAALGLSSANSDLSVEFQEMGLLCKTHGIQSEYPLELIEGFKKDSIGHEYKCFEDIEIYSYQVAGVVGLMMAKVMGITDSRALEPAKSLGIAMQFTNIARDVREDFERNRVYLPEEWLNQNKVEPQQLMKVENREAVYLVVKRLLDEAERYYELGYSGLKYLPFRAAVAVSVAGEIYSEIGRKVVRGGPGSLLQRTYVTLPEKIIAVARGIFRVIVRRYQ